MSLSALHILAALAGVFIIGVALLEGFETIVMPRTSTRYMRLTRYIYMQGWKIWRAVCRNVDESRREGLLSVFGPASLIVLMCVWAVMFVVGFGLLQWAQGDAFTPHGSVRNLGEALYLSGVTLFTLGYGDITPLTATARAISVVESGIGLGFLAIVIGYLPTLYQSFSRRETFISMLDSRAGSPPTAGEILGRYALTRDGEALEIFLKEWEAWCADVLESHLSYPVLAFYRSQHDRQSWISALASVMDTCALILSGVAPGPAAQARHTFAMGRHAIVDLSIVFSIEPMPPDPDRLTPPDWDHLCGKLKDSGLTTLLTDDDHAERLRELRSSYEPLLRALSERFLMPLPPWCYGDPIVDNWESDPWSMGGMSHLQ